MSLGVTFRWVSRILHALRRDKSQASYLPWEWAWHNGIFAGGGGVWIYKALDPPPLLWSTEAAQEKEAARLHNTLTELSAVARGTRWARFAGRRRFHLVSMRYYQQADTSAEPLPLKNFLDEHVYWHQVPRRAVMLGLQLRSSVWAWRNSGPPGGDRESVMSVVRKVTDRVWLDTPESLSGYQSDIAQIEQILYRLGWRDPTSKEMDVVQSWYEHIPGDGICPVTEYPHYIEVENPGGDNSYWQFTAVSGWRDRLPAEPWFALANSTAENAWVISARGELELGSATRARAKAQRRKLDETRRQTEESGDYDRIEDEHLADEIAEVEEYYALNTQEPSVAEFSLLAGRRLFPDDVNPSRWASEHQQTYADSLRETYNVQTVRLPYQQLAAAREVCPCAPIRIGSRRPCRHHVSLGVVTRAGFTAMSGLGDDRGAHMGYTLPDETEVRLDFGAASRENRPPIMLVSGQPGSGKTVVSQALLHQASLSGVNTIMVNPKGSDSLSPLLGVTGGEHAIIGASSTPGSLDPYRYAPPDAAVNIAMGFLDILMPDMPPMRLAQIEEGLRAADNPKCFMHAVETIRSQEIRDEIDQLRRSNPIVGLCMGDTPGEFRLGGKSVRDIQQGVLLVEFAGDIQLPQSPTKVSEMSRAERFAVGAVGLLMQATTQLIVSARRGQKDSGTGSFLIIDEAWIMLASKYLAAAYLESLARLGRSLDVTVVLATQRVSDVLDAGLEEYLSRVLLMQLTSSEEQRRGLELLGLDPENMDYRAMMRDSGSQRYVDQSGQERRVPPVAWMRDLKGRVGVIRCEFPDNLVDMYSTNPEDRRRLMQKLSAG